MPVADLYDLWERPAVPVRWTAHAPPDDRPEAVGFGELLTRAHEISSIAVSLPPALSALYRVLYALAARVSGLDSPDGWDKRREDTADEGRFTAGAIDAYGTRYRGRFRLYDPQYPFLQDPRLATSATRRRQQAGGYQAFWLEPLVVPPCRSMPGLTIWHPWMRWEHLLVWRYYGRREMCGPAPSRGGRRQLHRRAIAQCIVLPPGGCHLVRDAAGGGGRARPVCPARD